MREEKSCKDVSVRIMSKKRIKEANSKRPEGKASLESWHKIAKAADWKDFPGVKQSWRNVDLVGICLGIRHSQQSGAVGCTRC
jgi:hypothetical protein